MIKCPNCGKLSNGRICGYCGASLVENYFRENERASEQYPTAGFGSVTASVIGVMGGLTMLISAGLQAVGVYQAGSLLEPGIFWWACLLACIFCGALFAMQQIVLHGLRFSLFFDGVWLFVFTFGIGFFLHAFRKGEASLFFENGPALFVLAAGSVLCVVSCVASIFAFRKPE